MPKLFGKLSLALAMVGAALGIVASSVWSVPVSSAVIRLAASAGPEQEVPKDVATREMQERIDLIRAKVMGPSSLVKLVRDPALNLFVKERAVFPDEDVAEQWRDSGDIQIHPVDSHEDDPLRAVDVRISVAYSERAKAQALVGRLVKLFEQENAAANATRALEWQRLWTAPIPWSDTFEVLNPPSFPERFSEQDAVLLFGGTAAGILLAMIVMAVWASPGRAWRVAACAIAGGALGWGLWLALPDRYMARAVLQVNVPFEPKYYSGDVSTIAVSDVVAKVRLDILGSADEAIESNSKVASNDTMVGFRLQGDPYPAVPGTSFEVWSSDPDKAIARSVVLEIIGKVQAHYYQQPDALAVASDRVDLQVARNAEEVSSKPPTWSLTAAGVLLGILVGASLTVRNG